jgi:hypothetical protein
MPQQPLTGQVLDFGRYIIRIEPGRARGFYESDLNVDQDKSDLIFDNLRLIAPLVLPPQVRLALARAGYDVTSARAAA